MTALILALHSERANKKRNVRKPSGDACMQSRNGGRGYVSGKLGRAFRIAKNDIVLGRKSRRR
jgi:hypothetical protein